MPLDHGGNQITEDGTRKILNLISICLKRPSSGYCRSGRLIRRSTAATSRSLSLLAVVGCGQVRQTAAPSQKRRRACEIEGPFISVSDRIGNRAYHGRFHQKHSKVKSNKFKTSNSVSMWAGVSLHRTTLAASRSLQIYDDFNQ